MQTKKTAAVLATALVASCGGSGNNEKNDCNPPVFLEESIQGITATRTGVGPISDLAAAALHIDFDLGGQQLSSSNSPQANDYRLSFSLFPKAYAQSCDTDVLRETITSINITSTAHYDELHMPGDSLNDVFGYDFTSQSLEESLYSTLLYQSGINLRM